jgi:hypothetical protein
VLANSIFSSRIGAGRGFYCSRKLHLFRRHIGRTYGIMPDMDSSNTIRLAER